MASSSFEVPTDVLCAQGKASVDLLKAPANAPALARLDELGFGTAQYLAQLMVQLDRTQTLESQQERAKQAYLRETGQDEAHAVDGRRWCRRAQGRARVALLEPSNVQDDLLERLRVGRLPRARPHAVEYELSVLLPEAESMVGKVFGFTPEFVAEGRSLYEALEAERSETAAEKTRREELTRSLRDAERELSMLLRRLDAADALAAIEYGTDRRFELQEIRTYQARVRASSTEEEEQPVEA